MSTRACIQIIEEGYPDIYIYHYSDGMLSGVGRFLLNKLSKEMRDNVSYDIANKLIKDKTDDGYLLTQRIYGDEAYIYEIDVDDKTLMAYKTRKINDEIFDESLVRNNFFMCHYDKIEDVKLCMEICNADE